VRLSSAGGFAAGAVGVTLDEKPWAGAGPTPWRARVLGMLAPSPLKGHAKLVG
jgi:hypothetical protein